MKKTINKYFIFAIVVCILVAIDQISKYLVKTRLDYNKRYPVLRHVFSFEYLENRGVAFGFLSGKMYFITIIVVIVTLIIVYAIYVIENAINICHNVQLDQTTTTDFINNKFNNRINENTKDNKLRHTLKKFIVLQIICTFLIAGAIGNMIDRVRLGYVIDFIKFDFFNFPTFNVADCYVTISVCVLLVMLLFFVSEDEFEFLKFRK